ncbi:MAG: type VI secretion system transmembrane protein TssO [Crocinitomicaceae bacterium]|nr:type VI secretion system transmembrane protein TssO [Crocinitomicaceae bacterium]
MKVDSLSELFWRKVKYVLLFLLSIVLLYIVSVRYVFVIPHADNAELLNSIKSYEDILDKQHENKEVITKIFVSIDEMEFDIHQVQAQDEVNKRIAEVRRLYKDNDMSSKFKFGLISADLLMIYFNTKQEHSSLVNNKTIIEGNLMECKANI